VLLWILAALLLVAIWVGGTLLGVSLLFRVLASLGVALMVAGVLLFRWWRARRAAAALERELLKQAEQQAADAAPDRRVEIGQLKKQLEKGIASLRKSKLGGGGSALYALPWYAIIGPPGAGKTTALRASGLGFAFLDDARGAVQGIGGTRNCDWWFTDRAILLDTAGRYATESDDQPEWFAFLDLLRKYRPRGPLNGLLVAISIDDLAQASEEQVEAVAKKLRARIDEVITRLRMVLPVYVVFTKADLVSGFVEFWDDLKKSERAQIWGATLPLDAPTTEPREAFRAEFELLVHAARARAVKRASRQASPQVNERILAFPLELEPLSAQLGEFLGALFAKNSYQETPLFRGFYFTSGTQEGRPLDRVIGEMARAFGMRRPAAIAEAPKESKSYFLTDVFQRVIFPERELGSRTAAEARLRALLRGGFALASFAVIVLTAWALFTSAANNRVLVDQTRDAADQAVLVRAKDADPLTRVHRLDALRTRVAELDAWRENGAPARYRFGLYTGATLLPPARGLYAALLREQLAKPVHTSLAGRLGAIETPTGAAQESFGRSYDELKLYLMMSEVEHLDVAWASPRLTRAWAELLSLSPAAEPALKPHVDAWLDLLARKLTAPLPEEAKLVTFARSQLLRVPQLARIYEALVREVNGEIAGIRREDVFFGSIATFVTSKNPPAPVTIDGAYTKLGWMRLRTMLEGEQSRIGADRWVLGENEQLSLDEAKKQVDQLRAIYFERYKDAWARFLADQEVRQPEGTTEALDELFALTEPEWPYQRLFRLVEENASLELAAPVTKLDVAGNALENDLKRRASAEANKFLPDAGAMLGIAPSPSSSARPISPVQRAFKPIVAFAVPPPPAKEGDPVAPTGLSNYIATLKKLIGVLSEIKEGKPADPKTLSATFEEAYRATTAALADQDAFTRPLLTPFLVRPIKHAWGGVLHDKGGATGGLWEIDVWQFWNTKLAPKYPFVENAAADVALADFAEFYKPDGGKLWAFYDAQLKSTIERRGDDFELTKSLGGSVAYRPELLTCLAQAWKITNAFFPPQTKGDAAKLDGPLVDFEVNLHSVGRDVSEVVFTIDGVSASYKNEPERWQQLRWPAKDAQTRGGKIVVRGFGGLEEEISRPGDFGFFHLLDAATPVRAATAGKVEGRVIQTSSWALRAQPGAVVQIDLRAMKADFPLSRVWFRDVKCPRVIAGQEK
jgi:type VI secretion system protein ImpL